jgi:hypothetical protein
MNRPRPLEILPYSHDCTRPREELTTERKYTTRQAPIPLTSHFLHGSNRRRTAPAATNSAGSRDTNEDDPASKDDTDVIHFIDRAARPTIRAQVQDDLEMAAHRPRRSSEAGPAARGAVLALGALGWHGPCYGPARAIVPYQRSR